MERYQVILAYDGSRFKGFQRQAKARSVQGVVEKALRHLGWQGTSILAAGRTDTGVHATGQVIAFDLGWDHGVQDLLQALNHYLPTEVVAREVKRVNSDFHPRYDASWRRYCYRIYNQPIRQPLHEPYAWRVWPAADAHILDQAARLVVGSHDFIGFGSPPNSGGRTVRRVLESEWKREAPYLVYEVKAHAFLYHMVRRLVFFQVSIAQGKLDLTDLEAALNPTTGTVDGLPVEIFSERRLVHGLAPAQGLILTEVHYPQTAVRRTEDNVEVEKSVDRQLDPIGSHLTV